MKKIILGLAALALAGCVTPTAMTPAATANAVQQSMQIQGCLLAYMMPYNAQCLPTLAPAATANPVGVGVAGVTNTACLAQQAAEHLAAANAACGVTASLPTATPTP